MIFTAKRTSRASQDARRLGSVQVLMFSAWCGLAAGEVEVVIRCLYRNFSSTNRLYLLTRHFVWTIPLISFLAFAGVGLFLAIATKTWPRRAGWLSPRLIGTWALLAVFTVAGPQVYVEAWFILALGMAFRFVSLLERREAGMKRPLTWSFVVLSAIVVVQAGSICGADRLKRWREESRPLPRPDSPNVLLIVLDTVRADHLSLHGYDRPTSPTLERLARRAIRFDQARAAAPWTLASHASLFTGRWPRELAIEWLFPLRADYPTLAEYLGNRGYATAGFVGNTFNCSYDSGLNRGFTHYEDYVLDELGAIRTVHFIDLTLKTLATVVPSLGLRVPIGPSIPLQGLSIRQFSHGERKDAGVINRQFLDWLSTRREPHRPFLAFLNYADAHAPYVLPAGAVYRFGAAPQTEGDFRFLLETWLRIDKRKASQMARRLARDSYDNCLAYLDGQLGELFDELGRRGVLDQTAVIVTADHGEGFGEHDLFDHGESLYRPEIGVPLLISLPSRTGIQKVVKDAVSLRDIPATVVDLIGLAAESPFPGHSLASLWRGTPPVLTASPERDPVLSELSAPNPSDPNQGRSPAYRGPLIAVAAGDYVYIRNRRDGGEQLFNEREDPQELLNRAGAAAMLPVLQGFRDRLRRLESPSLAATDFVGRHELVSDDRARSAVASGDR